MLEPLLLPPNMSFFQFMLGELWLEEEILYETAQTNLSI